MNFTFSKKDKNSNARSGILKTDHGEIKTPIFMPVGTAGTVKSVSQRDLEDQVKALGFENANLAKSNEELFDRVNKLANRQPSWPKGYRPNNRPRR